MNQGKEEGKGRVKHKSELSEIGLAYYSAMFL